MDPLRFNAGFSLVWRNGDVVDAHTGLKCFVQDTNGIIVGHPTKGHITAYSWCGQLGAHHRPSGTHTPSALHRAGCTHGPLESLDQVGLPIDDASENHFCGTLCRNSL